MAISTISLGKVKFNWRGVWTASTAYVKDDVVSYGANAYIVTTAHTSSSLFADNAGKFDLMVEGVANAGVYSDSTLYKKNDIVTYGGAVYIALQPNQGQGPTNVIYWSSLVGGFQYLSAYSGSTSYKKGDIVRYGGNNYIATQDSVGNLPTNATYWTLFAQGFSFQGVYDNTTSYKIGQTVNYGANSYLAIQDTVGNLPTNATYWSRLTSGQITAGIYNPATTYKIGDLVQYGGYLYVCTAATTGNNPSDGAYWTQASTGFSWTGTYSSSTSYQKGEVVNYNGSSFVSISFNNSNNTPDASQQWALMMQGSANNVYTTAGDIAIRNNSAIVRLPIGSGGQVLSVGTNGLPTWENNGITGNVYYVSTNGVDANGYGRTAQRPFASLQYATQNVITPATIFVRAGSYNEQLPITVPSNTAIIGDSLRNTFINPKPNNVVTATSPVSNFTATGAQYSNGNATYASSRGTILAGLSTIQDQVITFLGVTYPTLSYNSAKCRRDISLIVNAVLNDLVAGSNYQSYKAGLSYLRSYASVVTNNQKAQTIAGINKARDLVIARIADTNAINTITANMAIITNIINNGVSAFTASSLSYPTPTSPSSPASGYVNSVAILQANRTFLQAEVIAYITDNLTPGGTYNANTFRQDVGYFIDAMTWDLIYGGNSQILDVASSYYASSGAVVPTAAYTRLQTVIQQVVQNQTVTKSTSNAETQVTNLSAGSSQAASTLSGLVGNLSSVVQNGIRLTVSSTTGIVAGMYITGTGFSAGQAVISVIDNVTVALDDPPSTTPSGTMTFTFFNYSLDSIPVVNNLSTMFLLSDGSMLKQMSFNGMTGFALSGTDPQDITTATIGGVFCRLNPASPIINKSPYITDCSCFSTGGVGVIVDGSVHNTGNKSMVFHAFTNLNDLGVGFWMKDNAKAEIVSCFTYYCHFGYAVSGGAKIRSLNGNNSYGTYGVVARGFDATESPLTATIYGDQLTYNSNSLNGNGFSTADTVTGLTSGARGTITNVQSGSYKIYYKKISGTFISGETITGNVTGTSATIASGGVSGQKGFVVIVTGLSNQPIVGTSIEFTGDSSAYVIQQVGSWVNSSSILQIVLAQEKVAASVDGTAVRIRANFSNARLTGHDFLSIGTGGSITTNYPGYPTQAAAPGNQTIEVFPGRVFYIATDQDGNFKVGNYFAVNQATGTATLNANAFNLSGLAALRLGSVGAQLGELISEFSSDVTLGASSNTKVPTQNAVKVYIDTKVANSFPTYLTVGTTPTTRVSLLDSTGSNPGTGASTDLVRVTVAGIQVGQFSNTKFTVTPGGNTAFEAAQYYIQVPVGDSTNRPNSPSAGYMRYNTTIGAIEVWNGSTWVPAGGLAPVTVSSATYSATSFQHLYLNTSSNAITVTLPASPNFGDEIRFLDVRGTFSTNSLTIARNGKPIQRLAENLIVSTAGAGFSLVYFDATQGWLLKDR